MQILELQRLVRKVPVTDHVIHYTLALVRQTRVGEAGRAEVHPGMAVLGCRPAGRAVPGPRRQSPGAAYGRTHVQTEDIEALALPVLRHRILTNFTAASEGVTTDTVIDQLAQGDAEQRRRTDQGRAVQEDFRVVIWFSRDPELADGERGQALPVRKPPGRG